MINDVSFAIFYIEINYSFIIVYKLASSDERVTRFYPSTIRVDDYSAREHN